MIPATTYNTTNRQDSRKRIIKKFRAIQHFVLAVFFIISITAKAQTAGASLFNSSQIHTFEFTFLQQNYWDTLEQNYIDDVYMPGEVKINGTLVPDVGIKFKGNSSYNNPSDKKSFKIDFNEFVSGQEYDGLKRLNLNNGFKDPSFLREKLTLDALNAQGIPAPRCTYAKLFINGTFWGLYMLVEEVNKKFLEQHFDENTGNLFKGDPHGTLNWQGNLQASYEDDYELKTNETVNDWSDLINLIDIINNTPVNNFYNALEEVLNTESFIKSWANYMMFVNLDSYLGTGHNYYIYHDSVSHVFEWINWDVNESFGNFSSGMNPTQLEQLDIYSMPSNPKPLIGKMLNNTIYKSHYQEYLCYLAEFVFNEYYLFPKMDSLHSAIQSIVYTDTKKFFTNADFDNSLTQNMNQQPGFTILGLKPFVTARRQFVSQSLENNGYTCTTGIYETANKNLFSVFPNPVRESTTIAAPGQKFSFFLFDVSGRLLKSESNIFNSATLFKNELTPGVYFIQVSTENDTQTKRIIMQ